MTFDSGLFVDHRGDSLKERIVSVAMRYSAFTFETWNDLINQKDYGPTFGARLTLDPALCIRAMVARIVSHPSADVLLSRQCRCHSAGILRALGGSPHSAHRVNVAFRTTLM